MLDEWAEYLEMISGKPMPRINTQNKNTMKKNKSPYKRNAYQPSSLKRNTATQGETLETKIERIVNNKEPIKDGAPLIYTERKEGVRASTNIRTDRWEVAIDGMDKVAKSYKARREERAKGEPKTDGAAEPIQATTGQEPATK